MLDAERFRAVFQRFMEGFSKQCAGVVAIDGKVLRRSFDKASGTSPLHMVSAWGCEQRLVLAQIATDAKSNEITAVPKLLEMLTLKGTIVTADALNCQRAIAQQIVDQGGDYALALKGNQETLHRDVVLFLDDPAIKTTTAAPVVDADHGRIETRAATVSTDIAWLVETHRWPGLKAVGKVDRIRESDGKTSRETAYYLLSAPLSPELFNEAVREHCGVENRLHWRLDIDHDTSITTEAACGIAPHNLAVLRLHGVEPHAKRRRKRLATRIYSKEQVGSEAYLRIAAHPVLKCDCPAPSSAAASPRRQRRVSCRGVSSPARARACRASRSLLQAFRIRAIS